MSTKDTVLSGAGWQEACPAATDVIVVQVGLRAGAGVLVRSAPTAPTSSTGHVLAGGDNLAIRLNVGDKIYVNGAAGAMVSVS